MKILKLLNKKYFSILLIVLIGFTSYAEEQPVDIWNIENKKIVSLEGNLLRLAIDNKIPRDEFIKFYIGNEINPNLKNFLSTNQIWKSFFQKNKDEFKNIRNRLTEISHKLGISVTDFKKLVSRVQKGEKE